MKADLHLHTTASDGLLSPKELVSRAAGKGFDLIAVTDHDSVAGVGEARREGEAQGVQVVAGAELSCGGAKEIHVLGLGLDAQNDELLAYCERCKRRREARIEKMVALLHENGRSVDIGRVREIAKGVMSRTHVARALVEAGHASSVSDAFDRFLLPGKCAYVPKEEISVRDAVALIGRAGGAAVLAHPMKMGFGEAALASLIGEWKAQGLAGIEVWHPSAQNNHAAFLLRLARREGMLVTGGSDFHGSAVRKTDIGEGLERWTSAESDVAALFERIR